MKAILIAIFFLNAQSVKSQTDSGTKNSKPSWGSKMPTRDDAPNLSLDTSFKDEEDEEDEDNDFGFDREAILVFDERDQVESNSNSPTSDEKISRDQALKIQQIDESKKRAFQQEQIEELRLLEEKQKEEKLAIQKALDEKAKNERIAIQIIIEEAKVLEQKTIEEAKMLNVVNEKSKKGEEPDLVNIAQIEESKEESYIWKKIQNVAPVYPLKAARAKKEGWVEIQLTLSVNGEVINSEVIKSKNNNKLFNKSAMKAVRKWKYDPPRKYGITGNITRVVRIVFQL